MYIHVTTDASSSGPARLMAIDRLALHQQRRSVAVSADRIHLRPVHQLGRIASVRRMATHATFHIHRGVGILEWPCLLLVAALALRAEALGLLHSLSGNFAVRVMATAATHLAVVHRVMHGSRKLLRNVLVALVAELGLSGLQLVL